MKQNRRWEDPIENTNSRIKIIPTGDETQTEFARTWDCIYVIPSSAGKKKSFLVQSYPMQSKKRDGRLRAQNRQRLDR